MKPFAFLSRLALTAVVLGCLSGASFAQKVCPKCRTRFPSFRANCTSDGSPLVSAVARPVEREKGVTRRRPDRPDAPISATATLTVTPVGVAGGGARILVNGRPASNGRYTTRLDRGNRRTVQVQVSAAGYQPVSMPITLAPGATVRVPVVMARVAERNTRASLAVSVFPKEAKVTVDGKPLADDLYQIDLGAAGSRRVKIQATAPGHWPLVKEVVLRPGSSAEALVLDEKATAGAEVSVTDASGKKIPNVVITVDGEKVADGKYESPLKEGATGKDVVIKVAAPGFETRTLEVTLEPGTTNYNISLAPPADTKGRLVVLPEIKGAPATDAVVTVNGSPLEGGRYVVEMGKKKNMTVEVTVTKPKYKPVTLSVPLEPGKPVTRSVALEPAVPTVAVLSVAILDSTTGKPIPGAQLLVDGKEAEGNLYREDLGVDGSKTVTVSVKADKFVGKTETIALAPGDITRSFTLSPSIGTGGGGIADVAGYALGEATRLRAQLKGDPKQENAALALVGRATAHRGGEGSTAAGRALIGEIKEKGYRNSAIAYTALMLANAGRMDEAYTLLDEIKNEEGSRVGPARAAYVVGLARSGNLPEVGKEMNKVPDELGQRDVVRAEVAPALAAGGKDEDALKMARQMPKPRQAGVLVRVAQAQAQAGRLDEAKRTLKEARDRIADIPIVGSEQQKAVGLVQRVEAMAGVARVSALAGDVDQTQIILTGIKKDAEAISFPLRRYEAMAWIGAGWAYIGDADAAFVDEAERIAQTTNDAGKARVYTALAQTYRRMKLVDKVALQLNKATACVDRLPDRTPAEWELKEKLIAELVAAQIECGRPDMAKEMVNRVMGLSTIKYDWTPYQQAHALSTIVLALPAGSAKDAATIAAPKTGP